jgi:hypothetical protein
MGNACSLIEEAKQIRQQNQVGSILYVFSTIRHVDISENIYIQLGFRVLTAASKKMVVFWVVTPCSLVEIY